MPFYEVLKLLMTEPSKHHFRRKKWENEYVHNDTDFITSIGITPFTTKILLVHKSNQTGYTFCPSAEEIIATDWYEVNTI